MIGRDGPGDEDQRAPARGVSRLASLRRSTLARNTAVLYGVHIAGLLLPLLMVPYLARVLRPEGWGLVVFAQAFASWLALVLEYGFYLSATRQIARVRDDRRAVAAIVAEVQGARALLLGVLLLAGVAAYLLVPIFRERPEYLVWAWLFAVAQGLSPFWYFQGVERMQLPALLEVGGKALATAGVFLLVKGPEQGWLVLALQAGGGFAWVAAASWMIYREIPLLVPTLAASLRMLRESLGLFIFRGASGMYLQANSFILGLVASASTVAYFGGAEKIVRAAISLIHPATQAIYPRISHLAATDGDGARRMVRLSLFLVGGLGIMLGLAAFLGAPWLVQLFLGPGYEAAIPVLRVLSLLPPVIAVGTVLGIQWALPMGYDRPFYLAVVTAGALNIVMAVTLAPRFGALGMAISVLLADLLVAAALLVLAIRRGDGILPGQRRTQRPLEAREGATNPPAAAPR